MAEQTWSREVEKVYYPGEDHPLVRTTESTGLREIPGECILHGVQTFVWNEGARWWHCPHMYVTVVGLDPAVHEPVQAHMVHVEVPVCRSVVPHEDFTPDGYDVIWYGPPAPLENPPTLNEEST